MQQKGTIMMMTSVSLAWCLQTGSWFHSNQVDFALVSHLTSCSASSPTQVGDVSVRQVSLHAVAHGVTPPIPLALAHA